MANPSPPASSITEAYITPTNVNVPKPSATFNLNGDLPSLPAVPSRLGSSESASAGVKLVGQEQGLGVGESSGTASATSTSSVRDDESVIREDTKKQETSQSNAAASGSGVWMGGMGVVTGLTILAGVL